MLFRIARQSERDPNEYVLSDATVDRYGDIIDPAGWQLANFKHHPIALFNHTSDYIVGTWENVRVESGKLLATLKLAEEGTSELVNYIRSLFRQGILKAVSVGFRPLAEEPLGDGSYGVRYTKSELVECSLVAVPANPNALQVARSLNLSPRLQAVVSGKPALQDDRERTRGLNGKTASHLQPGKPVMKISQRIATAQTQLTRLRDSLNTLSEVDEPTEEQQAQIDELNVQIPELVTSIEKMQATERSLAATIVNRDDPNGGQQDRGGGGNERRPFALPVKKNTPLDFLVRSFAISLKSFAKQEPIELSRQSLYGDDETTMWFMRAVVNPALTTVPGWAQELVATAIAEFMDTLKPVSVFPTLRGKGSSFTFDRNGGIIKVPGRAATPTIAGAWVGEGQPIPVRRLGLTSVTLAPKKLGVISDFSQEMADYSAPSIEQVIRQAMAEDTAVVIDSNLLDAVAASTVRPAGLRNGVAALTPSAATDTTQAMIADLKALIGAIIGNLGGRDIVVMMNPIQGMGINFAQSNAGFLFPTEGEAGRRFNVTFAESTTVPAGMVIAVDAADFSSASGAAPEYSVSNQATVHEEDTTPLAIGTAGTPPVVAAPVRSYWQTDTIGIRMRLPLNWAMRRAGMVSWTEAVLW